MKIVKREKVPTAYKHEIVGIVCDNFNCKKRIGYGDYYYDVEIESYTGETNDYENCQYCEDCALKLSPKLLKSNDLGCDLTFVRRKLYQGCVENIEQFDEEDLIRGHCLKARYEDVI